MNWDWAEGWAGVEIEIVTEVQEGVDRAWLRQPQPVWNVASTVLLLGDYLSTNSKSRILAI